MRQIIASSCLLLGFAAACSPAYIDVATPKDAQFELVCAGRCGPGGVEPGTLINVSFGGGARGFSLCCGQQDAFLQQLHTIRDVFCNGGDVPVATLDDLMVGTVVSEATKKRGATLDHGDGYVAFNCGEWLDDLIAASEASNCCTMRRPRRLGESAPPPAQPIDGEGTAPPAETGPATQPTPGETAPGATTPAQPTPDESAPPPGPADETAPEPAPGDTASGNAPDTAPPAADAPAAPAPDASSP